MPARTVNDRALPPLAAWALSSRRRVDDPAERRGTAAQHEGHDPNQVDAHTGQASGLGVATRGDDVAAERRAREQQHRGSTTKTIVIHTALGHSEELRIGELVEP